jgi:hypothetical protein
MHTPFTLQRPTQTQTRSVEILYQRRRSLEHDARCLLRPLVWTIAQQEMLLKLN